MFATTLLRNRTFWDISRILLLSLLHLAKGVPEDSHLKELSKRDALNLDVIRYVLKFQIESTVLNINTCRCSGWKTFMTTSSLYAKCSGWRRQLLKQLKMTTLRKTLSRVERSVIDRHR
jgi:hypothetical protein